MKKKIVKKAATKKKTTKTTKPTVKLIGKNGNAFNILGLCQEAAKKSGMTASRVKRIMSEMMSGDYNNLLAVAGKYFKVI